MLRVVSVVAVAAGCTVYTPARSSTVTASVGPTARGEVRLRSADGAFTAWMSASRLFVIGDDVCVRSDDRAWSSVRAVRVTQLTDANLAAVLADLPAALHVRHEGGGALVIESDGRDLRAWLRSRAHDPGDGERRYQVLAWHQWSRLLTWGELAHASRPMLGWPLAGTTAEVRSVDKVSSTILTVLAIPAVVGVVTIAAVAHAPASFEHMSGPQPRRADPRRLHLAIDASEGTDDGSFGTRVCDVAVGAPR